MGWSGYGAAFLILVGIVRGWGCSLGRLVGGVEVIYLMGVEGADYIEAAERLQFGFIWVCSSSRWRCRCQYTPTPRKWQRKQCILPSIIVHLEYFLFEINHLCLLLYLNSPLLLPVHLLADIDFDHFIQYLISVSYCFEILSFVCMYTIFLSFYHLPLLTWNAWGIHQALFPLTHVYLQEASMSSACTVLAPSIYSQKAWGELQGPVRSTAGLGSKVVPHSDWLPCLSTWRTQEGWTCHCNHRTRQLWSCWLEPRGKWLRAEREGR